MAVTSKNLHTNQPVRSGGHRIIAAPHMAGVRPQRTRVVYRSATQGALVNKVLWVLAAVLLSLVIGTLSGWVGTRIDDLRYGRPRTAHLSAMVGHEGSTGVASEFIAINLNRRVVVVEFPGGDATQARTIVGPYLFGAGEDLTPITLDLEDINRDAQPDLLVNIKNEQLVYINQDSAFRMITADEQQAIQQP